MAYAFARHLTVSALLLSPSFPMTSLATEELPMQFAQAPQAIARDQAVQRKPAKQQAPPKLQENLRFSAPATTTATAPPSATAPPATAPLAPSQPSTAPAAPDIATLPASPPPALAAPAPATAPAPAIIAAPPASLSPPAPAPGATVQAPAISEPFATLTSAPPATDARLNMVRTAAEQIGQVPGHFFWIRKDLQAAQDPVDGHIVFMNDEGRILGRAKMPANFLIGEVFSDAKEIRLIDAKRRQVVIPRTIDPADARTLAATAATGAGTRTLRLTRRSNEELVLQDERRAGSPALSVRSLAGGMLAQAYEVGSGSGDKRYLVSEEIAGTKPALQVRVFVQRFDSAGKLTGIVSVPLGNMDTVPRDFIAITGDGSVRVLVPGDSGVTINEIEFGTPPKARLTDDEAKSLGRLLKTTPVDSTIAGDKRSLFKREGPETEVVSRTPAISRDTILKNARAYLTVNWLMQRDNFTKSATPNACRPERGQFWTRPHGFTEAMIGTTIGPMPYRWGGGDTPETFLAKTKLGALAGDVCTCRSASNNYCLFSGSAGVDCSGFVSRAWGIPKRGTSGLLDVSDSVGGLGDLKPGDAFNRPGSHVRLFVGVASGANLAFTVLESSTRRDCEGVCERTYRPSELSGYGLIRYRGASDTAIAAVIEPAPVAAPPAATTPAPASETAPAASSASAPAAKTRVRAKP